MRMVIAGAVLASVLSGCGSGGTCYGIEPDGEKETLSPCPEGWKNGETRWIQEDEFERLEFPADRVGDPGGKSKGKRP